MVLVIVAIAAAFVVGWLRGGRFANLSTASLHGGIFAVVAALSQVVYAFAPVPAAAVVCTGVSQAALLAFLWCNRYVAGAFLAAVGSAMNAAVIIVNGAMPVSREALLVVSAHPLEVTGGRHRLLTETDALPWLADIIGLPVLRIVVSVGDVVLATGVALMMMHLMQPHGPVDEGPAHRKISRAASRRSR